MTELEKAARQALEALAFFEKAGLSTLSSVDAATALRTAIEQAEKQEPVAMQMDVIVVNLVREGINKHRARELAEHFIKHTHPPQRQWVGLTDEEIDEVLGGDIQDEPSGLLEFVRAIEAKLKEKNT